MEKGEKKRDKRDILRIILFSVLLVLVLTIFTYLSFVFIRWNLTNFHEKGHLDACKVVNISCELESRSFVEYTAFVTANILEGKFSFVEMRVKPNKKEFCNLSLNKQEIIKLGGFRNDVRSLMFLSYFVFVVLIILLGFILTNLFKKGRISFKTLIIFVTLTIIFVLILFSHLLPFAAYFIKNEGDLFYFPCN